MQIEHHGDVQPADFAMQVIERLNARYGVRLDLILTNPALSLSERRRTAQAMLIEAAVEQVSRAEEDSNEEPSELAPEFEAMLKADGDAVEIEPNYIVSEHNAEVIATYRGQDLYDYVFTLTKRFENMSAAKSEGQLAIEIVSGGLVSVGVPMAFYTIKALRAGSALLGAVKIGVTSLGMKTAIATVVIILVAFLLYLLLENPKKILGIVLNNTDQNFVVNNWRKGLDGDSGSDLYMAHGEMKSFMQDNETGDLDSPKVQLKSRFFFSPGDPDNSVCAGVFFADRNFGFRGSEGVMVFSSKEKSDLRVALQFAVPYTKDNGTNIKTLDKAPSDMDALFRDMYNGRKVHIARTEKDLRLESTVNDARGGVVALISCITQL
ncbi:hypothetical protein [Oceanicaulis sp.]|uniref:hypothetical protein n=1 Tax=Oceanicaulis sp. TaxID=1924941 RepID=UPI003D26E104